MAFPRRNSTLVTLALALSGLAQAAPPEARVSYRAQDGRTWTRWVLSEATRNGALLLVVEAPQDDTRASSQRVVSRRFFGDANSPRLTQLAGHYKKLEDRATAPVELEPRDGTKPLWEPVRDTWTLADERAFSEWFTAEVRNDYLRGSGLNVDCADFAMTVRWIYAHDHKLPVANTLAGSGRLFGHWSTRSDWDALPTHDDWRRDARFKAALRYLLSNAYTHSIALDLYPTLLTRDFVGPGSVMLNLYSASSGHTQVVNSTARDEDFCGVDACITVLYGNEPANELVYKDAAWIVNVPRDQGGLLRWRWPRRSQDHWVLTERESMPGYSLEQYEVPDLDDDSFRNYLYERLGMEMSDETLLSLLGNGMLAQLEARDGVTRLGSYICHLQPCEPGSADYEAFSTPSRDRRFRETQAKFRELLQRIPANDPALAELRETARATALLPGRSAWSYMINQESIADRMSADPRDSLWLRWARTQPAAYSALSYLQKVFAWIWQWRDERVLAADELCHWGEACDPNSPEVRALDTTRIDASLRLARASLRSGVRKLPKAEGSKLRKASTSMQTEGSFCGSDGQSVCTIWHLLHTSQPYLARMSSDPLASFAARYGAETAQP